MSRSSPRKKASTPKSARKKPARRRKVHPLCEGFQFRYFIATKSGRKREQKKVDRHFRMTENRFLETVLRILAKRHDLLEKIACMDNGLEVRLYKGTGFRDFENEVYFFGRVTSEDNQMYMELATDEVLKGTKPGHEALNVVVHELVHVLDFMDSRDGIMPGWKKHEILLFNEARADELKKLRAKKSPLDGYALTSRTEFLAVLAETYFIRPRALRSSSPVLYNLMKSFFRVKPEDVGLIWKRPAAAAAKTKKPATRKPVRKPARKNPPRKTATVARKPKRANKKQ